MIIGIGTDIVQIPRIEKILEVHSTTFFDKYFSKEEFAKYKNIDSSNIKLLACKYAKFFAAKESFVKALGTGFRFGINLKDIQILSDDLGKPYIKLNNTTKEYVENNFGKNLHFYLSLSDDYPTAIAFVTIEKED
ncbi:MAG: holo-ACP synthase [Alphaproteobacteria bacterium]|nr:holo-ACP synthase [Alphaproteobacteria bacterium]